MELEKFVNEYTTTYNQNNHEMLYIRFKNIIVHTVW